MTGRSDRAAAWYKYLSKEEAEEVARLETIMDHLKHSLTITSQRRALIQNRAQMRRLWREKTKKEK